MSKRTATDEVIDESVLDTDIEGLTDDDQDLDKLHSLRVTKSNQLIDASYKLSLNEQRVILLAMSQIDSRRPLMDKHYFRISVHDMANCYKIDKRNAYAYLKEAADKLYDRDIKRYDKNNHVSERLRWVFHSKYFAELGEIEIGFSPQVVKHLTGLSKRFTSYQIKQITSFSTAYSIRLYEYLVMYFNQRGEKTEVEVKITMKEFRRYLELDDLYPRFFDFNRRVIAPAIKEINKFTDIDVTYKDLRKGRQVVGLQFKIKESEQLQLL